MFECEVLQKKSAIKIHLPFYLCVCVCVWSQVIKLPQMRSLNQQLLLDVLDALADEMSVVRFASASDTASSSQHCS